MRSADRERALELRVKHKMGYGAIAKELSVPKSTLSYWLKDLPLSPDRVLELRRQAWSRGEASRELFRQTMRKKRDVRDEAVYRAQKKKLGTLSSQSLFVAGLMLYLAEGGKNNAYATALANTDPRLIKFFVWWLQKFLKVPKKNIRMQLHLYESMNIREQERFWMKLGGLTEKQLYKTQIRPLKQGSFSYSESFRHGTCQVYVSGRKYKTALTLSIKVFFDTYNRPRA